MDTVYIETSIISYLRQKPAKDIVAAAHQLLTHQWWDTERTKYELVVSQYVIDEASAGDPALVADRLGILAGIPRLPGDPEIDCIADEIISRAILPPKAAVDALHIASVTPSHTIFINVELQTHRERKDFASRLSGAH